MKLEAIESSKCVILSVSNQFNSCTLLTSYSELNGNVHFLNRHCHVVLIGRR